MLTALQIIEVGAIAGIASAIVSRLLHERQIRRLKEAYRTFALREYAYWKTYEEQQATTEFSWIGGMGASANILAAMMGRPAPWHADNYSRNHSHDKPHKQSDNSQEKQP